MKAKWFSTLLVVLLMVVAMVPAAGAAPSSAGLPQDESIGTNSDNGQHPLGENQAMLMAKGLDAKLHGNAPEKVHQVAKGQYVELSREGEDKIWSVLAEFGEAINPVTGGTAGPLRNQIPAPDRSVDNTSIWSPDFTQAYYQNLLFSQAPGAVSMRNFYIEQSSNRYTVNGDVTDWVKVPFNEARYGTNLCGSIVCSTVWRFVNDSTDAWYNAQIAAGKSDADLNAYLAQYDVWDRYDYNGNGNFNEPDGYIDHFQAIHAGSGEETGGGAQGSNAIWSHRWYAWYSANGPDGAGPHGLGGTRIGNTNYWVGDYTVEPEDGGVGVFSHEFGHDLGLPDLYDTSGNTGGAENSTGFWTLYSSGSYGSTGKPEDGIGSKPIPMSAYEKIFLGWSNYQLASAGQKVSVKLGPANANTKQAQQLVVLLPDKDVTFSIGAPYAGSYFYHSGAGNDLDHNMTRAVTLPAGTVTLSMQARYQIETCWDYAYVEVSTDGGATFHSIPTSASTNDNENGQNFGNGITGTSGSPKVCDQLGTPVWVPVTADLTPYAGQTIQLRFRYWTDGAVAGDGFSVDDIAITGQPTDGAETDAGWTYAGFSRTTGSTVKSFFNAYFAEFRTYQGYDNGLKTGPYNFGFPDTAPDWVEHYPYQDGLLVWYYDTSFADNNVGDNCASGRCGGLYLPVDAHPDLLLRPDNGKVWRPRIQSYDATFGLDKTDKICLHTSSTVSQCYGGLKANPLFDDTQSYWVSPNPAIGNFGWSSVPLPGFGVTIRVNSVSAQNTFMQVTVAPK
ncbi:MAG: immune inhibitor A domain-containing protein [Bacteroidota bacterium]